MLKKSYLKLDPNLNDPLSSTTPYFNTKQLASIYGFPAPDTNISTVVAVVSFGGGLYGVPENQSTPYVIPAYTSTSKCDVQKYWNYMGYTNKQMPKVIVYPVAGAKNNLTDPDGTGENTLDVSIIGGACPNPNLTIILFLFPNPYWFYQALPVVIAGRTVNGVKYVP